MPLTIRSLARPSLLAAALLAACGSDSGLTGVSDTEPTELTLRIEKEIPDDLPDDFASIDTAFISGDTLHLSVFYPGGCAETHEFGLLAQAGPMDVDPPEVLLVLLHDGKNDSCRAALHSDLRTDLMPIQSLLDQGNTLRLRLFEPNGIAAVDEVLDYTF